MCHAFITICMWRLMSVLWCSRGAWQHYNQKVTSHRGHTYEKLPVWTIWCWEVSCYKWLMYRPPPHPAASDWNKTYRTKQHGEGSAAVMRGTVYERTHFSLPACHFKPLSTASPAWWREQSSVKSYLLSHMTMSFCMIIPSVCLVARSYIMLRKTHSLKGCSGEVRWGNTNLAPFAVFHCVSTLGLMQEPLMQTDTSAHTSYSFILILALYFHILAEKQEDPLGKTAAYSSVEQSGVKSPTTGCNIPLFNISLPVGSLLIAVLDRLALERSYLASKFMYNHNYKKWNLKNAQLQRVCWIQLETFLREVGMRILKCSCIWSSVCSYKCNDNLQCFFCRSN